MIPKELHQEALLYKLLSEQYSTFKVHEYEVSQDRCLDRQTDITSQAGYFSVFIMTV